MQNYKRNVTYFYQYHNGMVGTTAGFLKMEIRGDKVKITINIQEPSHRFSNDPALYFYHETGDYLTAVKVDEVRRIDGVLTYQTRTSWQELFDTGRDLYTFDGVLVLYSDNDYYLGDFQGRDRRSYAIRLVPFKEAEKEGTQSDEGVSSDDISNVVSEETEGKNRIREDENEEGTSQKRDDDQEKGSRITIDDDQEDRDRVGTDKGGEDNKNICNREDDSRKGMAEGVDDMLKNYPKLPLYGSIGLADCVRIQPKDIGRLDIGNWKLGSNSFLTHGYYIYKYLLLGKMRFDDGIYHMVLGVPGVYSNREKYMANMFGFDQFVPVKNNGTRTGEFGYWVVEVRE